MSAVVPIAGLYYEMHNHMRVLRKRMRDRLNPFDVPENKFKEMYRLPINITIDFIEEIREVGNIIDGNQKNPLHLEILLVLNFFASGSYQRRVGSDALAFMSQPKISKCVRKYATIIAEQLSGKYIRFPQTPDEINNAKASFLEEYGFPNIIGRISPLIDRTHIAITGLKNEIEHSYVNRKCFHSINTQLICNNDLKIINCNARYCGSTHDSYIWACSQAFTFLQLRHENGAQHEWLLGDSGNPLQPFLLTNIQNLRSPQEKMYNRMHCKIRSKIERCIGLLKNRFRCLSGERKLRYDPKMVTNIVTSCIILHNIIIDHHVYEDDSTILVDDNVLSLNTERDSLYIAGQQNRNWVIDYLNSNRRG